MIPGIGILAVPGDDPAGISKYFFNILADYKPDEITVTPAAQTRRGELRLPPIRACLPDRPCQKFSSCRGGSCKLLPSRIKRRDLGHLDVELTIHDPEFYSKPITMRFTQTLMPDDDLLESVCENERDRDHMRPPGPPPGPPQ